MKTARISSIAFAAALAGGCDTFYQNPQYSSGRQEEIRIEMARQQQARDFEVVKARSDAAEQHLRQIDGRLGQVEASLRGSAGAAAEIDALRREIDGLRAAQETLKKEVVDDLSREIAKLLAEQTAAASRGGRGNRAGSGQVAGYEHKVQSGQTLSAIAVAYGVTVDAIKRANNLGGDTIRVGQVLFIPD